MQWNERWREEPSVRRAKIQFANCESWAEKLKTTRLFQEFFPIKSNEFVNDMAFMPATQYSTFSFTVWAFALTATINMFE